MKILKKFNRDKLYKIELKNIDQCYEYCLCDVNDGDEIYAVLEEKEVE